MFLLYTEAETIALKLRQLTQTTHRTLTLVSAIILKNYHLCTFLFSYGSHSTMSSLFTVHYR